MSITIYPQGSGQQSQCGFDPTEILSEIEIVQDSTHLYLKSFSNLLKPSILHIDRVSGSRSYIVPNGINTIRAFCIGAGAFRKFYTTSSSGDFSNLAHAGGGAYCEKLFNIGTNKTITYTVGAGRSTNGDGGNSSITYGGTTIIAGGGKQTGTVTPETVGGVASGGDIMYNGGSGGKVGVGGWSTGVAAIYVNPGSCGCSLGMNLAEFEYGTDCLKLGVWDYQNFILGGNIGTPVDLDWRSYGNVVITRTTAGVGAGGTEGRGSVLPTGPGTSGNGLVCFEFID